MTKDQKCDCGYTQTIREDNRKQDNTYRCTGCGKTNSIKALIIATVFLMMVAITPAYADTQTFFYETENLNKTLTGNFTQFYPDGSWEHRVLVQWIYQGTNATEYNPEPVKSDPVGKFFELLLTDGAGIFKPLIEPIGEFFEDLGDAIANVTDSEPEPVYDEREQEIVDTLEKYCDKLSQKLEAIGLAYDFRLEHEMQWYFDHSLQAVKIAQDCRARLELGNNVLSSQYEELAKQSVIDAAEFNQTVTTQGPRSMYDVNMTALMEAEAKLAQDMIDSSTYLGVDPKQADPVIPTNTTQFGVMSPEDRHEYEENYRIENLKELCRILWAPTGNGTTALRTWDTNLTNGMCDNFVYITQWEIGEDGFQHKVTKQVDLRAVINMKLAAGEEL